MTKKIRPQSKKQNLVEQEVDGELLIYDLERNRALCLNQTSALVWQACDGKRTVAEINGLLGKHLQAQTNEDVVWLALDQLSKEKLIDPSVDVAARFEGLSRREVVKRIGVGSAVALPIVAGLLAPPAFAQASVCGTCVCGPGNVAAGAVCATGGAGVPCSVAGCTVCRANSAGANQPGTCFMV